METVDSLTYEHIVDAVRKGVHRARCHGTEVKAILLGHQEYTILRKEAQPFLVRYEWDPKHRGETFWRNLRVLEVDATSYLEILFTLPE